LYQEIAIIGPTASGKSELAINIAKKSNSYILSLDSLSIYKEIDIASAKPSKDELKEVLHFGIDIVNPCETFSVVEFFKEYKRAKLEAKKSGKNLIIVGGSSFYLKSLIDGLSQKSSLNEEDSKRLKELMRDLPKAYEFIKKSDEEYAKKIKKGDRYRIEKWYEIYLGSKMVASEYFKRYKKEPIIKDIKIYEILVDKDTLKKRVEKRTKKMIESGLVEEAFGLVKRYGRNCRAFESIGLKEAIMYLDGKLDLATLEKMITQKTMNLAKRQSTFNKTQLKVYRRDLLDNLTNNEFFT
jgi:tRNA dimethylallyltransferase